MRMRSCLLALLFLTVPASRAQDYGKDVRAHVLGKADTTAFGQKIVYPVVSHPQVTALEVEIPPGGETGWHTHPFPGYAYVLAGELTLESRQGKLRTFVAGETILESVNLAHNGRNLGPVPVRLVAFFTGDSGRAVTVLLPASGRNPQQKKQQKANP